MNTRNYKTAARQSNIIDPWRPVIEKQMCIKKEKRSNTTESAGFTSQQASFTWELNVTHT